MKSIQIEINNVKKIKELTFTLKLEQGYYAIIGDNGSGKSTLMTAIAKLVKPSIFRDEFLGSGSTLYKDSKIKYRFAHGEEIVWTKNPNWSADNFDRMPKLNGFFESSILSGTRFHHLNNKAVQIKKSDLKDTSGAPSFIVENLEYIINGSNTGYFSNLRYFGHARQTKNYFLKLDDESHISEFSLSTGEYFMLSLLKIIYTFSRRKNKEDLRVLIIDELDIALHPYAQRRLTEKLKEWKADFNLLIIFATHSLQIINSLKSEDLYYIQNGSIINPIYPAYLTSQLFEHNNYDKIILVEDELAKRFVEHFIDEKNMLLRIIPIGGWEKVLEIKKQNKTFQYFGCADVIAILDGDVEKEASKKPYKSLKKFFLPVSNIEKHCVICFFDRQSSFHDFLVKTLAPSKILDLDIVEYSDIESNIGNLKTDNIKNIFNKLVNQTAGLTMKTRQEVYNQFIGSIIRSSSGVSSFIKFRDNLFRFLESNKRDEK